MGRIYEKATMSSSDKELEAQLLESGNKLVEPPSDVDELLPLLDVRILILRISVFSWFCRRWRWFHFGLKNVLRSGFFIYFLF